jgi:membrane peptidoglycan carboxypeptidase
VVETFEPKPIRRVMSRRTAARLTDILVGVVEAGTGKRAAIPGYQVAGKTGTAQKADPGGGYSRTDFVLSFVGFVPSERPQLTCLVVLDSPEGESTGGAAAEVFARIAERSLHYLGVPPRLPGGTLTMASNWPAEPVSRKPRALRAAEMEDMVGLSARDALARAVALRLVPELVGSGWVVEQDPAPGQAIAEGARCTLILGPRGSSGPSESGGL